ncbi:uncharacterized protein Tco025E_09821, partial [Trypanosoma conorhini]
MSRHLFSAAVLLLLCVLLIRSGSCESASAEEAQEEVRHWVPKPQSFAKVNIGLGARADSEGATGSFRVPGLVDVNGETVVFAGAHAGASAGGVAAGIAAGGIPAEGASAAQGGRVMDDALTAYFPQST